MIPEFGTFSLIVALCLSLALAVIPLMGASTGNVVMMNYARPLASGVFVFLTISFACLFHTVRPLDLCGRLVCFMLSGPTISRWLMLPITPTRRFRLNSSSVRSGGGTKALCCYGYGF